MTTHSKGRLLAAIGAACTLGLAITGHAQNGPAVAPAIFRVVHGIPGRDVAKRLDPLLPVDVLIDGKLCLLRGLTFGQVAGPYSVPAGSYEVAISLANTVAPCSNAAVIDKTVTLAAGEEAAVVAALSPQGAPTADAFALDLRALHAGIGRVMVAHAADAPAVDVLVNGAAAITGLTPGQERSAKLPAGTYQVAVAPAGTTTPVVGPLPLTLDSRSVDLVFAVGSAASGSITVVVAAIPEVF